MGIGDTLDRYVHQCDCDGVNVPRFHLCCQETDMLAISDADLCLRPQPVFLGISFSSEAKLLAQLAQLEIGLVSQVSGIKEYDQ
jgi:hypothetical protein